MPRMAYKLVTLGVAIAVAGLAFTATALAVPGGAGATLGVVLATVAFAAIIVLAESLAP